MAWYKEWFGAEYLELYAHRDEGEAEAHARFVLEALGMLGTGAVLDLACGAGRHTAALRRHGVRALGIDLSLTLLLHPPRVPAVCGDMRSLPIASGSLDWVLNFFTSFGYFEGERENFRVLEEIVRVLKPGGRFLLDFLNRERVLAELEPRELKESDGRRVEIERWYDPGAGRINKRIRVVTAGQPPRSFLESVRAYSRDEVTIGLRWAGAEVDRIYGSFEGEPFDSDSPRLILVGHRPS